MSGFDSAAILFGALRSRSSEACAGGRRGSGQQLLSADIVGAATRQHSGQDAPDALRRYQAHVLQLSLIHVDHPQIFLGMSFLMLQAADYAAQLAAAFGAMAQAAERGANATALLEVRMWCERRAFTASTPIMCS